MKSWRAFAIGALLVLVAAATFVRSRGGGMRSVRPLLDAPAAATSRFERRQSAALFVGVRSFTNDSVNIVPYAVDDAIDLAYVFALEPRVALVPPRRVVLALSGEPEKRESKERLASLRAAGADVRRAGARDVVAALRDQAALAGRDGLLIVSLATHGFLRNGDAYVLASSSVIDDPATTLPTAQLFDTIASSAAQRSLVFIDACRERMKAFGTRSVLADVMSAAPLVRRMGRTRGQVVFYAAAAGQWAYDDPAAKNGVFTKAVIAGLRCGAAKERGVVTAETLATFVERTVGVWIREHRDPSIGSATQVSLDGEARHMPLAQCTADVPGFGPSRVDIDGRSVHAIGDGDEPLWQHDAPASIVDAKTLDLDSDGTREVVVATRSDVTALNASGQALWSVSEPSMTLRSVKTANVGKEQMNAIVALWRNAASAASRLAIYRADGTLLSMLEQERLDLFTLWRPTKSYAAKLVATSGNMLFVLDPKKLAAKPLWVGRVGARGIRSIAVSNVDGDRDDELVVTTDDGATLTLNIKGNVVAADGGTSFKRVTLPRRTR